MSHWFHRNPLKATGFQNFELKMFAHDSEALKIISDMKQSRARLIELLPDPHHTIDQMETALKLYMALLRGFLLQPGRIHNFVVCHHCELYAYLIVISTLLFMKNPNSKIKTVQEIRMLTAS